MMKREKRRAPPTAIAVSVNSLNDVDCFKLAKLICCAVTMCIVHVLPPNKDVHEAAKDEDEEASVQGSADVGEVPLGLNKDYTCIFL